jgi:hypothetical protein
MLKKLYKTKNSVILFTRSINLDRIILNRKIEKENNMFLIDLARVQSPDAELNAAIALRESKVARLKEQMGSKYLLHPDNMVRLSRPTPQFLLKKENK